jgi:sterol desaturase/sphingolipid hydroxylase (fatty acid hydroxylase superfamily)
MINPILYAVPVFLALIGFEIWIAYRRRTQVYRLNDALGSLTLGTVSQVVGALTKFASLGIYIVAYNNLAIFSIPMDQPLIWVGALILYDFCHYWLHRMSHEVYVLWAAHVVHHSSEEYNLTTALRQTSSGFLLGWIFYLPMAIVGIPPVMFAVVGLIDLLYQFWIHTREIGSLGWFDKIFASPSNHRVHHGQNDYCIDRNYGGVLMIWDHMFGTFVDEKPDEEIIYGIRGALKTFDPIEANLSVYAKLWRESAQKTNWRDRLAVWLARPSAALADDPNGFDAQAFRRYDPSLGFWAQVTGFVDFLILLNLSNHYTYMFPQLSLFEAIVEAALLVAKGWCLARIFDNRSRAALPDIAWSAAAASAIMVLAPDYYLWAVASLIWGLGVPVLLALDGGKKAPAQDPIPETRQAAGD